MNDTLDPRAELAKIQAETAAAKKKAEDTEKANAAREEELKKQLRGDDLQIVKELCRTHGFTATDLKGFLKTRKKPAAKR